MTLNYALPKTYNTLWERTPSSAEKDKYNNKSVQNSILGLLTLLELVENDHITIALDEGSDLPAKLYQINTIPIELEKVFNKQEPLTYVVDDVSYEEQTFYDINLLIEPLGKIVQYNFKSNTHPQLMKLSEAINGGRPKQNGLGLLQLFKIPSDEKQITETRWGNLTEPKRTMIDQIRTLISIVLE
jgi:hypothetical protein